eukprot:IDg11946t1
MCYCVEGVACRNHPTNNLILNANYVFLADFLAEEVLHRGRYRVTPICIKSRLEHIKAREPRVDGTSGREILSAPSLPGEERSSDITIVIQELRQTTFSASQTRKLSGLSAV